MLVRFNGEELIWIYSGMMLSGWEVCTLQPLHCSIILGGRAQVPSWMGFVEKFEAWLWVNKGFKLDFFSANSFDVVFLRADWGELGDGGVLRIDYLLRVNENAIKAYQILVVVLSCLHKSSITRYRLVKTGDVWLILTVLRFYLSFSLGRLTDGTRTS